MATRKGFKVLFAYVTPEMHEALRQLSFEDRLSICEITRQAIGRYLSERAHEWHRKQEKIAAYDETMASGIADGILKPEGRNQTVRYRAATLKKQRKQKP